MDILFMVYYLKFFNLFYLSFSLTKKKQKVKTIRQPPSTPQKLTKMAVCTELTKGSRTITSG
jgi:hypothetical protein